MGAVRLEPLELATRVGPAAAVLEKDVPPLMPPPTAAADNAPALQPAGARAASSLPLEAFEATGYEAESRLVRILGGEGYLVTTGQQPQLFGGPLYVLYKALSAIRLALDLEAATGTPCLALFWVASDDHDWPEVASIGFLDAEEELRTLVLPPPAGRESRSVGPCPLPPGIGDLAAEFRAGLEVRPEGESWADALYRAYVPGRTVADAFIEVLRGWMGDLPLALLDSAHPAVRQASAPLLQRVLKRHDAVDGALAEGAARMVRAGQRPQLTYLEGASPVFADDGRSRQRVYRGPDGFRVGGDAPSSEDGLFAELASDPYRFSPAAALRPVLESYLLPVRATVLGPGELAYWAQLRPLFDSLEVSMPAVRPRSSWRVIEPRVDRLLEKTGVTAEALADGGDAAATALVEQGRPRRLDEALLTLEDGLAQNFASLEQATAADMPGVRSSVGKAHSEVRSALAGLRKAVDARTRERGQTKIAQVRRAARHLYPGGVPQERVVSPFCYLVRYGDAFLDEVRAAHGLETGQGRKSVADRAVAGDSDGA